MGMWKVDPMALWRALGPMGSADRGETTTLDSPNQSATRISVPTLPGSAMLSKYRVRPLGLSSELKFLGGFAVANKPGGVFMADIISMSLLLTSVVMSGVTPSIPDQTSDPSHGVVK